MAGITRQCGCDYKAQVEIVLSQLFESGGFQQGLRRNVLRPDVLRDAFVQLRLRNCMFCQRQSAADSRASRHSGPAGGIDVLLTQCEETSLFWNEQPAFGGLSAGRRVAPAFIAAPEGGRVAIHQHCSCETLVSSW